MVYYVRLLHSLNIVFSANIQRFHAGMSRSTVCKIAKDGWVAQW